MVPRGPAVQVGCAREGDSWAQPADQARPRKAGSTRVLLLQVGKTTVQVIRLKLKRIKIQNKKGQPRLKPARPWRWGWEQVVSLGDAAALAAAAAWRAGVQGGGGGAERGGGDSGGSRAAACPLSVSSLSDGPGQLPRFIALFGRGLGQRAGRSPGGGGRRSPLGLGVFSDLPDHQVHASAGILTGAVPVHYGTAPCQEGPA